MSPHNRLGSSTPSKNNDAVSKETTDLDVGLKKALLFLQEKTLAVKDPVTMKRLTSIFYDSGPPAKHVVDLLVSQYAIVIEVQRRFGRVHLGTIMEMATAHGKGDFEDGTMEGDDIACRVYIARLFTNFLTFTRATRLMREYDPLTFTCVFEVGPFDKLWCPPPGITEETVNQRFLADKPETQHEKMHALQRLASLTTMEKILNSVG